MNFLVHAFEAVSAIVAGAVIVVECRTPYQVTDPVYEALYLKTMGRFPR